MSSMLPIPENEPGGSYNYQRQNGIIDGIQRGYDNTLVEIDGVTLYIRAGGLVNVDNGIASVGALDVPISVSGFTGYWYPFVEVTPTGNPEVFIVTWGVENTPATYDPTLGGFYYSTGKRMLNWIYDSGRAETTQFIATVPTLTKDYVDTGLDLANPIGAIYVQYSGKASPAGLFGGTWSNISDEYAGRFFRSEGGDAASYGGTQSDAVPDIYGEFKTRIRFGSTAAGTDHNSDFDDAAGVLNSSIRKSSQGLAESIYYWPASSGQNKQVYRMVLDPPAPYGNTPIGGEVRPTNSTIRVWERIS